MTEQKAIDIRRGDYLEGRDHLEIGHLILSTKEFIVFIDKEGNLDWETTPEYDNCYPKDAVKHNSVMNDAALLEAIPCEGLSKETVLRYKRLIGEAMARSIGNDYASARKMLTTADTYIRARGSETSRFWYLSATSAACIPFIIAGTFAWAFRVDLSAAIGTSAFWLFLACTLGACGALLSVISRSGKLQFDWCAGIRLHFLEGSSRIIAGALSGFVVALAVKSEVFLAPLSRDHKLPAIMMLAAFSAGACERLAGSIISKLEAHRDSGAANRKTKDNEGSTTGG